MSRIVIIAACTASWSGDTLSYAPGQVLEAPTELAAAIGAGNYRAVAGDASDVAFSRDQLGQPFAVSNSSPAS